MIGGTTKGMMDKAIFNSFTQCRALQAPTYDQEKESFSNSLPFNHIQLD